MRMCSPPHNQLQFVEGWKRITNDSYVLSIVTKGYRLRFTSPPLLRKSPWEIRSPQGPKEILAMREQISFMLQKNAVTEVLPNSPGFYSNAFLVRKASGKLRPVIDHSHFCTSFRMFTTSSVLSTVRKGDYKFKIDLQDAYFHIPIHPSSRKYMYLRFAFENKIYQFRVLPFSLNTAPQILLASLLSSSIPIYGLTQLGLRSYPSESFVLETITTLFSFLRSDRPVYATESVRPLGPCQPTAAMAGPDFSYLWNPYPSISSGIYDFFGRIHSGVGLPYWGFPNFGYLDPCGPRAPYQLLGAQGGRGRLTSLGFSAPGPPGLDSYGQFDSSFLYQQARRDPVHTLLRLAVELFMWLQAQNIVVRARHIPGCLNVIADHSRPKSADNDRV